MVVKFSRFLLTAAAAAVALAAALWVDGAQAADDPRKFIDALRERRYLDTAAEYLDQLASNPNLGSDTKKIVTYEQALVLIDIAAGERDPQSRDEKLGQAQARLKEFLAANGDHELAAAARGRLASLLRYRASNLVSRADNTPAEQAAARKQAQAQYSQAKAVFQDSAKRLRAQLDALPKSESQKEQREQIGGLWLGASLNVGRTSFDMALLEEPQSEERKKLLMEASEQCGKLYENYPQRLAGLTARLYEGRCYEELGDPKQAVEAYTNVINDLPDGDATFRALKTQALKRAVDLWLQDKEYEKAVDKSAAWAKTARGAEIFDPDWLALKLSSAKALIGLAGTLPTGDDKAAGYRADAKSLALDLLKSKNSEFQGPASGLLTQIGRTADANDTVSTKKAPTAGKKALIGSYGSKQIQLTAETREGSTALYAAEVAEIKTFDAAFEKAGEAEDEIKTTQLEISFAQQEKPDAKQIADLKATAEKKCDEAFAFCQRAIALSDEKTDLEKLNHLRYLLCYFHYSKGNYDDAVVIGETVAKKHPKATNARDAARVALASLDVVYRQRKAAGEDVAFESAELQNLIDYIIKTWPDDPVAGAASEILVNVYTTGGDYEKALAALERLPENSPARVEAQLRYGQSLWAKYLRTEQQNREAKAAASGDSSPVPFEDPKVKQEFDALLKQAQDALERGVAGLRKLNDVTNQAMLATVSLAQLYENGSKADQAIALLEDPKIGPMTLVKRKHPATQAQGMAAEVYKTALRSYIDAEPQQIDKATAALDALEKIYAEDPQGSAKLTQMLVSIAVDLKQQLEELSRQGDRDRQARLTKAFDRFLSRIPERSATADFKILNWVGATYENLAGGLNTGGKLVPGADGYYRQAIKAYEDIISRAKTDPNFAPPDRMPAVKRNLAVDYRSVGEYEKAISVLAELLKETPLLLPVQVEAARTYQARGAQDPTFYVRAIEGGDKPETANIWGWSKLSVQTSRDQRFRDIFHDARYNLALCRKRFAEASDKAEVKKVALQKAKYDIRNTMQFDATMGGEKWKPQYESLLKEIQTGLSEEPVGLQALEEKNTNAKDGAKN